MELTFFDPAFEMEVRETLGVYNRPVTAEDAESVSVLQLWNFDFRSEDIGTLLRFSNLRELDICIGREAAAFRDAFPAMEELYLEYRDREIDLRIFAGMENLTGLTVSGGDLSGMEILHPEALAGLKKLQSLTLHEFGRVDLAPLAEMKQLRRLSIRYADRADNIEAIGQMAWLEYLLLDCVAMDDRSFLERLPHTEKEIWEKEI